MFRVLPDNRGVMHRWGVVKIESHGRRSIQHVNRDTWRRGSRYPRAPILIDVLASAGAVIDLVTWVIHVVALHHDPGSNVNRRGRCMHHRLTRSMHVTDATGQRSQKRRAKRESGS